MRAESSEKEELVEELEVKIPAIMDKLIDKQGGNKFDDSMKVSDIRDQLINLGLPVRGKKAELLQRLRDATMKSAFDTENRADLDKILLPDLPLLLSRSFVGAARKLLGSIKTEQQREALLTITKYVIDVQNEIADKIDDMEREQINKMRELILAAKEGGTEVLSEVANSMKEKGQFNSEFINYLNYAIEQEEVRLKKLGFEPFKPEPLVYGLPPSAAQKEAIAQEQLPARAKTSAWGNVLDGNSEDIQLDRFWEKEGEKAYWMAARGVPYPPEMDKEHASGLVPRDKIQADAARARERLADSNYVPLDPNFKEPAPPEKGLLDLSEEELEEKMAKGDEEDDAQLEAKWQAGEYEEGYLEPEAPEKPPPPEEQKWLLTLNLVKKGVYTLLSKDYEDDVEFIRLMFSVESRYRPELVAQSLTEMKLVSGRITKFQNTLRRIITNLAVPRNEKDVEIRGKVIEIDRLVKLWVNKHGSYDDDRSEFAYGAPPRFSSFVKQEKDRG